MAIEYDDFTVRFSSLGGRFRAQAEGPTGSAAEPLEFSAESILNTQKLTKSPDWWREHLQDLDVTLKTPAEEVGRLLFETLFRGTVGRLFDSSSGHTQARQRGLRLVLRFDPLQPETEILSQLPWELLYRKEAQQFLALEPRSPIVRHLDNVPQRIELGPLRESLRILVAIPAALGIDFCKEKEIIRRSCEHLPVEITYLENATRQNLARTLAKEGSHVLHYIGHGGFSEKTGEGFLRFADASGQRDLLSGTELAVIARNATSLRFVFLNSCKTARALTTIEPQVFAEGANATILQRVPAFSGVANAMVLQGVPAVLAMQATIGDEDAIEFTQAVYHSLTTGSTLEEAVSDGRGALYAAGRRNGLAIPVLFSRTHERVLTLMSPTGLSTLWTLLGLLATDLTFNVLSRTQGFDIYLPGFQFQKVSKNGVAIYGMILGIPLIALLLSVTLRYLRARPGKNFADRLPIAFGVYPSLIGPSWRTYQATFLFLFLIFPMASQIHFYNRMLQGTIWKMNPKPEKPVCMWTWQDDSFEEGTYTIGDPSSNETFYPLVEPLGLLICEIVLLAYFAKVGHALAFGRRERGMVWRKARIPRA